MSKLIQMAYISTATFSTAAKQEIVPEISKILQASRRNNKRREVVGALYFGNGYFFQVLEGEEKEVLDLYETIKQDQRHHSLHILFTKPIVHKHFAEWEMKYVPSEAHVQQLLKQAGLQTFNPYQFDEAITRNMVQLLLQGKDDADMPVQVVQSSCDCLLWQLASAVLLVLLAISLAWQWLL